MKKSKLGKKIVTLGLATVMIFSFSMMAFAYQSDDREEPLGDTYMRGHIDVDGSSAHASMDLGDTGDLSIEGSADYYNVYEEYLSTGILSGAEQTTSCGTTRYYYMSRFVYATAHFSASSNDGGDNSMDLACEEND